ncbi:MAG: hypothetical protein EZS28_041643 [Streblomastix strix]|uniref:DUF4817 domain-containing protein n=1 Tax=Streblomastix strix TaxID=222440 RepID=A0A5J4TXM6_9EUKA|nr:MAG: hypothetical protein EZS28_041643 [Streblomastix strix]
MYELNIYANSSTYQEILCGASAMELFPILGIEKTFWNTVAKHYWVLVADVDTAFDAIKLQYTENHPTQEAVAIWFDMFNSGNFSILNDKRTGRHKIPNMRNQIQAFQQIDKYATIDRIASQLGVAQSTVLDRHHNELHYVLLEDK